MPPIYVDRSTAGGAHEVFENTNWESQDLVRLELQWPSPVGNTNCEWTRGVSLVALEELALIA